MEFKYRVATSIYGRSARLVIGSQASVRGPCLPRGPVDAEVLVKAANLPEPQAMHASDSHSGSDAARARTTAAQRTPICAASPAGVSRQLCPDTTTRSGTFIRSTVSGRWACPRPPARAWHDASRNSCCIKKKDLRLFSNVVHGIELVSKLIGTGIAGCQGTSRTSRNSEIKICGSMCHDNSRI